MRRRIRAIQLECLVIGLTGQLGVDVAKVFVGDGIGRMSPDRHFKCRTGLVVLLLLGVEHSQVVVGFGKLRVVFGQLREHANGFCRLVQFGEDQAFEEAALRILGAADQVGINLFKRLRELSLLDQALYFGQIVGKGRGREADGQADGQGAQRLELLETRLVQGFSGHRYATIFRVVQSFDSIKKMACTIGFSTVLASNLF